MNTANFLAPLVFLIWPVLTIALVNSTAGPRQGALVAMFLAMLFLPERFAIDLPLIPSIDKRSLPAVCLLVALAFNGKSELSIFPKSRAALFLIAVIMVQQFGTALTNTDPVFLGEVTLPPLAPWDGISGVFVQFMTIAPFLIGRSMFYKPEHLVGIARVALVFGLIYAFMALVEIRLSPQLHTWTYGYFQHTFSQMVRGDGFRPIAFFSHGLVASFFLFMVMMLTVGLRKRADVREQSRYTIILVFLFVVMVLSKSLGALLFTLVFVPVAMFASPRLQVRIASILCIFALVYPLLRTFDYIPTDAIVELANSISAERAFSLQFRFDNEDTLVTRAFERPIFGWGAWDRNLIHDASGRIVSITDGYWIILTGASGMVGFLATFSLLALPVFWVQRQVRRNPEAGLDPMVGLICLLVGVNMIELLPNATRLPLLFLLSGALLGYAERAQSAVRNPAARSDDPRQTQSDTPENPMPARPRTIL